MTRYGRDSPKLIDLGDLFEESMFIDQSFENLVFHNKKALMKLNSGVPSKQILSKCDREHLRNLGVIKLTSTKGRRYELSERAKQILSIK